MNKEEEIEEISWSCWMRTLFAASGPMMMYVLYGVTLAQTSVMLPALKRRDSYIHITPDEETWIASLGIAASPISALLVGPTIDKVGRKNGIFFFFINMGIGLGIIACATEVWHLYVGRIMLGFSVGVIVTGPVYLAEICTKKQRSLFLSAIGALSSGGSSLAYVVGFFLPWNIASAVFSLTCFVYFIVMCFTPESPAWLFRQSNIEAATRSLQRLGRSPAGVLRELELLRLSNKEDSGQFEFQAFLKPTAWKPFVILSLFHLLTCLSGGYYVMYYTVDLIERVGTTHDPLAVGLVLSIARVLANFTVGLYFTAYVGRRFATAFSGFCMSVASGGAGVYEYVYRDVAVIDRPLEWLPVTLITVNIVSGFLGAMNLPWLLVGEVFPLRVRGAMTGAVYVVGTMLLFVDVKMYGTFLGILNIWGLLFFGSAASSLTIFLGVLLMPETLNKTLYEVEQSFLPKKERQQR